MEDRDPITGPFAREILADGVSVTVDPNVTDYGRESNKDITCCILAESVSGGHIFSISLREGMTSEEQDEVSREAVMRFGRLAEHGPDHDGWQVRSDGILQLWLRWHDFGELPSILD